MTHKKEAKTLEEIKEIAKEPEYGEIEKFAKVTETERGLIIRIPNEIKDHHKIKKGDKIRFYTKLKEGEDQLIIERVE